MWERVKNFFSNAWVQWGLTLAAIGGTAAYIFTKNDFSRPPIPEPEKPQDYSKNLDKLDPKRPIGILVFNVHSNDSWGSKLTVNTSRNNFIEKMHKHYGDNVVVIDCPSDLHFSTFSKQFNERFSAQNPEVHFVGSHHTNHPLSKDTYNKKLADFITSIQAGKKRANILSCGPESKLFEKTGCEYIIIPRPDGEILGPEFDLEFSPAYRDSIGWMAENSDPEAIRKKFNETSLDNMLHYARDRALTVAKDIYLGEPIQAHKSPIVVVPTGLPPPPVNRTNLPPK
jgi:hypothetical protein